MEENTLHQHIIDALIKVAPDIDPNTLDPVSNFRDQIDIDSVDFLGFVLNLEKRLDTRIPEIDYPKLSSLKGCIDYLQPLLKVT